MARNGNGNGNGGKPPKGANGNGANHKGKHGGARPGAGRPPIVFTDEQLARLDQLAKMYCTDEEIAAVMGVSADTLRNHDDYSERIEKGRHEGKASLRRAQFKAALGGNVTAQIWLGKQILDQTDRTDVRVGDLDELTDAELEALATGRRL